MTKFKKTLTVSCAMMLAATSVLGLVACGEEDEGGGRGGNGGYTTVVFWGGGDANETTVFGDMVAEFNRTIGAEKKIRVEYTSGHEDYDTNAMQLSGNNPPDVVYVPDRQFKKWADAGYLDNLTGPHADGVEYEGLEEFTNGSIWEQGINRYRFDRATATSTPDATLWALPKDIGPSVLYYNREYLEEMGIKHISMTAEEAKAAGYPEKGYFEKDNEWYFNNKVPMSWDEVTSLGIRMQTEIKNVNINGVEVSCNNGYFTEWWFNYGWSIGGDCVEYVPEGEDDNGDPMGYYKFTLNDTTPNWIVKDDCAAGVTVNGTKYNAGEIISYTDKTAGGDTSWQDSCNKLPTMYDAFLEFVSLTSKTGVEVGTNSKWEKVLGKQVSLGQTSIGTQSARDRFAAGTIGMFVGLRAEVTHLRKEIGKKNSWMSDNDSWDVAPLPLYKEYNSDGSVKVHGVQAGHSGSMGLAIARRSKHKNEAWELVKYIAGVPGQTAQAEAGFCIPNQINIAKSETFLQPDKAPKNSQVFVDAAQYETPADWWYLTDWNWIDDWADALNNQVREPDVEESRKMTVEQLFNTLGDPTQTKLYKYTYSKHPGAKADPHP